MERLQLALQYKMCNNLISIVHMYSLPIEINVAKCSDSLRIVSLRYDADDELLIEWLIYKVENCN